MCTWHTVDEFVRQACCLLRNDLCMARQAALDAVSPLLFYFSLTIFHFRDALPAFSAEIVPASHTCSPASSAVASVLDAKPQGRLKQQKTGRCTGGPGDSVGLTCTFEHPARKVGS